MEAIPKEVIDMAEDFFIHLNAKEKQEILGKYYREQPHLSEVYNTWLKTIKYIGTVQNSEQLFFVIYRSYQYYGIKVPLIKEDEIRKTYNSFTSNNTHPNGQPLSNLESMLKLKTQLQQDYLMDYVIFKLLGNDENPPEYTNAMDVGIIFTQMFLLLWIFNNAIKKHHSHEIN